MIVRNNELFFNYYVPNAQNQTDSSYIRKINLSTGIITQVAGTGIDGFSGDGGPTLNAQIEPKGGLTLDGNGSIYFGDVHGRIRKIDLNGTITSVTGNGTVGHTGDSGPATLPKSATYFNDSEE